MKNVADKVKKISLVIFDVDGVLTDGNLILGESGNEYKTFYVRDGHGLVMLRESGCQIAVITARNSTIVSERMKSLGIEYVFQGQNNKGRTVSELMVKLEKTREETAYVGDDFIDLPAMQKVGFSIAVADAHAVVQEQADWVTSARGGRGAVREVCELILESRGLLQPMIKDLIKC